MNLIQYIAIISFICSVAAIIMMSVKRNISNSVSCAFAVVAFLLGFGAFAMAAPRDLDLKIPGFDYLGFVVALFAILTTVLLGWQLYNVFSLKEDAKKAEKAARKASKIEEEYNALREKFNTLEQSFGELKGKISVVGEYVDSPEWAWVVVDAEDKLLFGIKSDGSIDWSVGIPGPIQTELDALKKRISELEKKETNAPGTSGTSPEEPEA